METIVIMIQPFSLALIILGFGGILPERWSLLPIRTLGHAAIIGGLSLLLFIVQSLRVFASYILDAPLEGAGWGMLAAGSMFLIMIHKCFELHAQEAARTACECEKSSS